MHFIISKIVYKKLSKELNYQSRAKNKLKRGLVQDKIKYIIERGGGTSLDKIKYLKMYRKSKI